MYTVKIKNEYLHGPLWVYNEDGIPVWNPQLIQNDPILKELNEKAEEMFSSYYEFDSHNLPCWFNKEQEIVDKDIMIDLIAKMISRLNEINDGSFIIEDLETERLKSL